MQKNPQLVVTDAKAAKEISKTAAARMQRPDVPGELLAAGPARPPQTLNPMNSPKRLMEDENPLPLPYGDARYFKPQLAVNFQDAALPQWMATLPAMPQPGVVVDVAGRRYLPQEQRLPGRDVPGGPIESPLPPAPNGSTDIRQQQLLAKELMSKLNPFTGYPMARQNPGGAPGGVLPELGSVQALLPPTSMGQYFDVGVMTQKKEGKPEDGRLPQRPERASRRPDAPL